MFNIFKKRVKKTLGEKSREAMNTRDIYGRLPSFIVLNDKGEPEGRYGDKLTFISDRKLPPEGNCLAVSDGILPEESRRIP